MVLLHSSHIRFTLRGGVARRWNVCVVYDHIRYWRFEQSIVSGWRSPPILACVERETKILKQIILLEKIVMLFPIGTVEPFDS